MINDFKLNMEALTEVYCYEFFKVHNKYPEPEVLNRKVLLAECAILRKKSARSLWELIFSYNLGVYYGINCRRFTSCICISL